MKKIALSIWDETTLEGKTTSLEINEKDLDLPIDELSARFMQPMCAYLISVIKGHN